MPPPTEGKPSSLSSFDSGFDGAGCSPLEAAAPTGGGGGGSDVWQGQSVLSGSRESFGPPTRSPQTHKDNLSVASDSEDLREAFDFGSAGCSSRASIQIVPKLKLDSLNFEIKVQRSATPPQNPWLSLPVDDLEKSYTVTITPNTPEPRVSRSQSGGSRDQPTQTEATAMTPPNGEPHTDPESPCRLRDPGLSPIRDLLSSTITDGKDKSDCTTEGNPTLIWDSYDLHDQNDQNHGNDVERYGTSISVQQYHTKLVCACVRVCVQTMEAGVCIDGLCLVQDQQQFSGCFHVGLGPEGPGRFEGRGGDPGAS